MRNRIYPYHIASRSARTLRNNLPNAVLLKLERSRYTPREDDIIINWGNSTVPTWYNQEHVDNPRIHFLNHPDLVANASDKLKAFAILAEADGVHIPPYTEDIEVARDWYENDNKIVLGRDLTRGSGGRGITIYNPNAFEEDETIPTMQEHKFYTQYIKKKREFRIHVGKYINNRYEVFYTQEKKRRNVEVRNQEDYNGLIRNYANEWVFVNNHIVDVPISVYEQAEKAVKALQLDFGAVDIIYNEHYNTSYVLEVNTACGMEGNTINRYKEFFNTKKHEFRQAAEQPTIVSYANEEVITTTTRPLRLEPDVTFNITEEN